MRRTKRSGWPYSQPPNVPFELNKDSPQAKGITAWWPTLASRGSLVVLRDLSGYGNDGIFPGGAADPAWIIDGEFGAIIQGDGTDDYVSAALDGTSKPNFGIAFWYRPGPDTAESRGLFQWAHVLTSGTPFVLIQEHEAEELRFYCDNAYQEASTSLVEGEWTHIAVTRGLDDTWSFYRDGKLLSTHVDDGTPTNQDKAVTLYLGNGYGSGLPPHYANGAFADFRVYWYCPSGSTVWQIYDRATRWELYKPLVPWTLAKSPITIRIPRYGFTSFQVPGIV